MKEPSFQKNGHTKLLAISTVTQIPWPKFTEWSEFIKCRLTVNIKQMLLPFMKPWNLKYSIISMGDIPTWRLGTDKTLAFTGLMGTSPAVHWLKIHLLMQGTWVRSLVQKDLTDLGATTPQLLKPMCSRPVRHDSRGLCAWSLHLATRGGTGTKSPCISN